MSIQKFTYEELEDAFTENLYLIERLQAEIERLEAECERQYEQAKADIRANISDGGTSCHWCMDGHRAETVKEFADRLKDDFCDSCSTHKKYRLEIEQCRAKENPDRKWCFKMRLIDNLVKKWGVVQNEQIH